MSPPRCLGLFATLTVTAASAERRSVDDILSLHGKALFEAARKADASEFSMRDVIRIAESLSAERNNIGKHVLNRSAFDSFFERACDKADVSELAEVIQLYVSLDPQSFEKSSLLWPLAARWIHEELKNISSDSLPRKLEGADAAVPAELENAPSDLMNAWKIFKQATRAYDLKFERRPETKMIGFQSNERAFYRLVDELLLKRDEGLGKKLANFGWRGGYGTGSEFLFDPQSLTVFMALLHGRGIAEAIGAAVYIRGYKPLTTRDIDVRIEFLEKCGVDWELVLAGAQLDSEVNHVPTGRHKGYLRALAAYGSDRAAALVAKMAQRGKAGMRQQYADALAAFITRGSDNDVREVNSSDIARVSKGQVSQQTKLEIIRVLQEFATPDASEQVVRPALQAFRRAKLPGTIATLSNLTKHRSAEVAQAAANILNSMGKKFALPAPPKPVCFQILINGGPIHGDVSVAWSVYGAAGGMVSSAGKPNEEGMIEIKREHFLDPERKPKSIALETGAAESAREPFFYVPLPVPVNLDSVTRVDVDLQSMELKIHGPRETQPATEQKATIHIERNKSEGESEAEHIYHQISRTFDAPAEQPMSLMLQPGSYRLEILLAGAERYTHIVTADARNSSIDVQLRPGADVHVEPVRPDDQRMLGGAYLTKPNSETDLKYCQDQNGIFRGLPCGDYVLHIPSSADLHSRDKLFVDAVNYTGRQIPFRISDNSPPLIDLGTIRLDPAAK